MKPNKRHDGEPIKLMMAQIDEITLCSEELLNMLQEKELDMDAIPQLEQDRKEKLHQLFEQTSPEQLQTESDALAQIQQLDQEIISLANERKEAMAQELLKLKRGKDQTSAYKTNRF